MIECLALILTCLILQRILIRGSTRPLRMLTQNWLEVAKNKQMSAALYPSSNLNTILDSFLLVVKAGRNHQEWSGRITALLIKLEQSGRECCMIHRMIALRLGLTCFAFYGVLFVQTNATGHLSSKDSPLVLFSVTMIYIWTIYALFSHAIPKTWFLSYSLTDKAEQYLSALTSCYLPNGPNLMRSLTITNLVKQEKLLGLNLHKEKLACIDSIEYEFFSEDSQKMQRFKDAIPVVDLIVMLPVMLSAASILL